MSMEYTGLSYFPVDANFFEENVTELLEAKFGIQASYIIMRLLCKIYKEGYYISWGKEQCIIFLRKIGGEVKEDTMNKIINLLLEKDYFNKECYDKNGVLTSISIQKVWLEATIRRKHDFSQMPYFLLDVEQFKQRKKKQKNDSNEENENNLPVQQELKLENDDTSGQSKEKHSRVEENKASSSDEEAKENTSFEIPGYAYNKFTHNLAGLMENLEHHRVTDTKEQRIILRLSDFGRKGTPVWKLFLETNWNRINTPGKYIIATLAEKRKDAS